MTINLADNSPRISYAVASGVTQTSFVVPFEFFSDGSLNVYVDTILQTLNTDYTVTGGDGSTGSITMSVTGAAGGSTVVITRSITLERTSDFPTSGPFQINALNTELDRLVAIAADLQDQTDRSLKLTDYDVSVSLTLPDVNTRKGKTLAFNESTGAVEAGPSISNVQSVSVASADIATLADIEDGTVATNTIQTVASISANVTTVAGISANVTTVAGVSTDVTTVADNIADVSNVSDNMAAVLAADDEAAAAAASAASASSSATAAAASASAASTSETNAATSETNAATSATTSATNAATSATNAATSGTNAANALTSENNAATSETNAATSETNAATSATAAAASQTAAAASAASAASAYDSFDDRYLGPKSADPTLDNDGNALVSGALYFNSTANEMRVYDGANWIAASSAGGASLLNYNYTATSGQTTFSGADDNAASLSYTQQNLIVTLNGIVLEDGTDYTASNGTSIVLAAGAAAGDELNVVAFKSFTTADMVPASTGGTFSGAVAVSAGGLTVDNDAATVLTVDRATSNGTIIDVQKDWSSVGNIGVASDGVSLDIAATNSGYGNLKSLSNTGYTWYTNGASAGGSIYPDSDGTRDLGEPSVRFRDLRLSGGVYLGGTGSANKLDDYEEGTWTPVVKTNVSGTTMTYSTDYEFRSPNSNLATDTLTYTKIGNRVFVSFSFWSNTSQTIRFNISLPFAFKNSTYQVASSCSFYKINTAAGIGLLGAGSSTFDTFALDEAGNHSNVPLATDSEIYYSFSYETT